MRRIPLTSRKCEDWLWNLLDYVEDTESPRHFWLWSGISTIASALQRKVYLPFGLETIFPNLYVMLVAVPGECRKGAPLSLSKKLLTDIGISVFADSPTKRALTKSLDKARQTQTYRGEDGIPIMPSSMSVISKEFSSFLAVDPKAMIEALTDLYDSHDEWIYQTSGEGTDKLFKLCLNAFIATTPDWIANNLPEEAIGGGFTTRVCIVSGKEKYKWISLPPPPDEEIYNKLKHDLKTINQKLIGKFRWGDEAYDYYDAWYNTIPAKTKQLRDTRLRGNLSRIHIASLKVAMCLHVSYSDELVIEIHDLEKAIKVLENSLATASEALSGHGRSRTAVDVEKVSRQLRVHQEMSFSDLLEINFRDTNRPELTLVLETLEGMNHIELLNVTCDAFGQKKIGRIKWIGVTEGKGKGGGGIKRGPYERKPKE